MKARKFPSIFNDVIGPIMRGPSSSHCAASVRIGRIARDLMEGDIDPKGSLATTHDSQGSDMGLCGGFLGWEAYDERLMNYEEAVKEARIKIKVEINDLKIDHPNTYRLTLKNAKETHEMIAISTGGGMIEIVEIDRIQVSMVGDCYETLIYTDEKRVLEYLQEKNDIDTIINRVGVDTQFIELKSRKSLNKELTSTLRSKFEGLEIKELNPVLPILSNKGMEVPFNTCEEMLRYNEDKNMDLWELAIHYESTRGNISSEEVFKMMKNIVLIMRSSISNGIKGTKFSNRILGYQSGFFKTQMKNERLLDGGILNKIILYITAMMEIKSSMGVIVAAPTAGACGTIPGSLLGAASEMDLSDDDITKAMFSASIIGIFLSNGATFSAEVGGCQAECGSASGMAAAGLVTLKEGNTKQAIDASSMALQNSFGMVCDPVANRVEVPCLGKNVMAASNALSCANMALANFDVVVPLDEVIEAMNEVGRSIPYELRCTALGGLSSTKTSKALEERLRNN
ncbi:MAG: L-serine ammonia-lyase, iron-sulfur-dependent, subunit alpha [Candidatus Hodarchaeales archaeon]|jgi:L-serine dehydratase